MVKQIILFFNVIILAAYQLMFGGSGVSLTQKLPENVSPGQTFEVTVTINKGAISGFAKFEQDFPAGFKAVKEDAGGGSFTCTDGKTKIIWMSLPSGSSFTIKYKVTAPATAQGSYDVGGKFLYIADNARQSATMPASTLKISSSTAQETTATSTNNNTDNSNTGTNDNSNTDNESGNSSQPTTTTQPESNPITITCQSDVTQMANANSYSVTIRIDKQNIKGFAKLEEEIPAGFVATELQSANGSFSFSDNKVKILWMSVPPNQVVISYKLTKTDPNLSGDQTIAGTFSYLDGTQAKKYVLDPLKIHVEKPVQLADNTTNNQNQGNSNSNVDTTANNSNATTQETTADNNQTTAPETNTETASNENNNSGNNTEERMASTDTSSSNNQQSVASNNTSQPTETTTQPSENTNPSTENNTASNGSNNENKVNSTPAPEKNITYKVQVAAGHKSVSNSYFKNKYKLYQTVSRENNNGWIKYTIGSFKNYKAARDKRNQVWNKNHITDAFVTAYQDGQRITVQEALMASNQKWYK